MDEKSMRWFKKLTLTPKTGSLRIKKRFLWFPVKINNETRWLETTLIIERYQEYYAKQYPLIFGKPHCYKTGKWERYGFFGKRDEKTALIINVDKDDPYGSV